MKLKRRVVVVAAIATAVICLLAAAFTIWRAQYALSRSLQEAKSRESLPFETRALAGSPNPGFESISAPAVFRGGAIFNGRIYLSGPAGLYAWSADGSLQHIYRVGLDLPAAPLGPVAVGSLADAHQPELLMATTGAGVLAFDGHVFRQILPADAAARQITALLPLPSGRLLLGTPRRGLLIYDGHILRQFHETTGHLDITALAGTESDLWVGTLSTGLLHWHGGETEHIGEAQGLPDSRVDAITIDGDRVYAGTPMGIAEFEHGRLTRVIAAGRFAHALHAESGALLVGQFDAGIMRVPLADSDGPASARVRSIAAPSDDNGDPSEAGTVEQFLSSAGRLYAVAEKGLEEREPDGSWQRVLGGGASLLTDRNISALMPGADGRLWVGYFDRGLDILSFKEETAQHVENDRVFCINRIVENPQAHAVAVATANGLLWFDGDGHEKQVLDRASGLIASHVTDVALYRGGVVAATPAGITFLDETGPHSLYAFEGLVNNHVYALGVEGGQLLAGTLGGISLIRDGAVSRNWTTANSGLKHNWITGFARAGDGWLVGTYGAGVLRFTSAGVSETEATHTGIVVNPNALVTDGRIVLAGTLGQGLLVADASGMRWRTVRAGLPSLNVTALAIDNGVVYVGTDNGLVKIAENRL